MSATKKLAWAAAGVAMAACLAVVAYAGMHGGKTGKKTPSLAEVAAKQEKAAELAYPEAGAAMPASVKVEYDPAKDRTRMTLELKGLRPAAAGARVGGAVLTLTSEFKGRERAVGEVSVKGELRVETNAAGVLAPASPPGAFVVDGARVTARAWEAGKSGYTAKQAGGLTHEELEFRVRTRDLVKLAGGRSVTGEFGAVKVELTAGQVAELKEFVARMKPAAR